MKNKSALYFALAIVCLVSMAATNANAAATIVIVNNDPAGVGFNDPTAAAPVGGNSGTTLGQQRLIAFQAAANKWGATLTSSVTIRIRAQWTALTCTATSAVLGSAGATEVFRDFTGAIKAATWYGKAEANALSGADLDPATPDINANFNVNLGKTGCLTGTFFYLGLDGNHGANIDLVTVLTHEFGHGLGFQTYTNASSGAPLSGFPSIWDFFLFDDSTGKFWVDMTNAERAASSINTGHLVWTGANVTAAVPQVLLLGTPRLAISAPASVAGDYTIGLAGFGAPITTTGVTGEIMPVIDTAPNLGLACNPLTGANAAAVSGKIALVDRGVCGFAVKALICQNAGAIGVIIANNAAGPPPGLGGFDAAITVPTISISQADGVTLKAALATRTRLHSGMLANIGASGNQYAGASAAGLAFLFAPNPFQSGSSVSHYSDSMYRNQLMEPAINGDLTHEVTLPYDMTYELLKDIGWN